MMNRLREGTLDVIANDITLLQSAVIKTLLYFDIFNHPLNLKELYELNEFANVDQGELKAALYDLEEKGIVFFDQGFYSTSLLNSERRISGERFAKSVNDKMRRFSKLIASFPFVKAVTISGSLSKNWMDKNSDIDFFIITSSGRLWIARTLLVLYKKLFLLNSKKNFCVNYFITEDSLEIPDQNIFTATEVSYLIPVYNYNVYLSFMRANKWAKTFYPNFPIRNNSTVITERFTKAKSGLEKLLNGKLGERIDNIFFKLTLKRWKKKFPQFDEGAFDLRMRSKKNVSKHHPNGFQEKVLGALEMKILEFEKRHRISLSDEKSTIYA